MKASTAASLAVCAAGSLLACNHAHAVITGLSLVPVSFEQGWLDVDGGVYSEGSPTTDAIINANVAAAWAATGGAYMTFRLYIDVDDELTGVNGLAGDAGIDLRFQELCDPQGFFNFAPPGNAGSAGPQVFGSLDPAQGARAFDSYLTVNGAAAFDDEGDAVGALGTEFDALRGATNGPGGLGGAMSIDCTECGYFSTFPVQPVAYSYNSATSLAYNGGSPISGLGVMVGQFTLPAGHGFLGNALAVGTGTTMDEAFAFSVSIECIPAPPAAAPFVAAGLTLTGRRRRTET